MGSVLKALIGCGVEQQECFCWRHFHHFLDENQSFVRLGHVSLTPATFENHRLQSSQHGHFYFYLFSFVDCDLVPISILTVFFLFSFFI